MKRALVLAVTLALTAACGSGSSTELTSLYFEILPVLNKHGIELGEPPHSTLIEEPKACCSAGCVGPYHYVSEHAFLSARKAGCQLDDWLWVSRRWPPICREEWPGEPHCVFRGTDRSSYDYRKTYVHELFHWIEGLRGIYDPLHEHQADENSVMSELGFVSYVSDDESEPLYCTVGMIGRCEIERVCVGISSKKRIVTIEPMPYACKWITLEV